jgi:hypothetical protein
MSCASWAGRPESKASTQRSQEGISDAFARLPSPALVKRIRTLQRRISEGRKTPRARIGASLIGSRGFLLSRTIQCCFATCRYSDLVTSSVAANRAGRGFKAKQSPIRNSCVLCVKLLILLCSAAHHSKSAASPGRPAQRGSGLSIPPSASPARRFGVTGHRAPASRRNRAAGPG